MGGWLAGWRALACVRVRERDGREIERTSEFGYTSTRGQQVACYMFYMKLATPRAVDECFDDYMCVLPVPRFVDSWPLRAPDFGGIAPGP